MMEDIDECGLLSAPLGNVMANSQTSEAIPEDAGVHPTPVLTHKLDTESRAKIFAALSDPTRLRIVELLAHHAELSGSEIAATLGISLALFCHHSRTLVEVDLLKVRREGQTKYNSLNRLLLGQCFTSLTEDPLAIALQE